MPLNEQTHRIFNDHYGTTLEAAAESTSLTQRLGKVFSAGKCKVEREEPYGRGYVGFGNSVSAEKADQSTMRMVARW
jgi:hypothetical protein